MAIQRRDFLKLTAGIAGGCALAPELALGSASTEEGKFDDKLSMLNDSTRCVGCRGCQNQCKETYGLDKAGNDPLYDEPLGLNPGNYTVIKLYEEGDKHAFWKKQCMHCNEPACVSACPVSALHKHENGAVTYDPSKCIGCRYCMVVCPFKVPTFNFSSATPQIHKCHFCYDRVSEGKKPVCVETCPTGAIAFGTRRQMIDEAWRRIKAEPDRYVPHVYGEHEVGGTSVVTIAGFDFPKLGLDAFDTTPLPGMSETIQHGIFKYFMTPLALFGMLALTRGATMKCDPLTDEDCIEE